MARLEVDGNKSIYYEDLGGDGLALGLGHARAHGATQLSLTTPSVNAPGLGFYRSVGFSKVRAFSITDSFGDDQGEPHTLELTEMRMDLAAIEAVAVT